MNSRMVLWGFFIGLTLYAPSASSETRGVMFVETESGLPLYQSQAKSKKAAFVDMVELFNQYPGTEIAANILQNEMAQKMPGREILTAELERLSNNGADEAAIKAQLQRIQQYDDQVQKALDARQNEVFAPVFNSIEDAVKRIGARNGYHAIYVEPREDAEDITSAVLNILKK